MHTLRRTIAAFAVGVSLLLQQGIVTAQTETSKTQDQLGEFISALGVNGEVKVMANPESKPDIVEQPDLDRHDQLTDQIASKFGRNKETVAQIVTLAKKYAYPDFPKFEDILAITSVESGFNPKAYSQGNVGAMQINIGANGKRLANKSLSENMRVGAFVLNQYYGMTGKSRRGAVLAYNAGIGSYYKKRYNPTYYAKYLLQLQWITARF